MIEDTQHLLILRIRNQVAIPQKIGTEIIVLLIELVVVREEAIAHGPEKGMTVLKTKKGKKLLSKHKIYPIVCLKPNKVTRVRLNNNTKLFIATEIRTETAAKIVIVMIKNQNI